MSNLIFCKKLKKQAKALPKPPIPTPLGQQIYEQISEEAWQTWQQHQTRLINEYRLDMTDKKARAFLTQEMKKFLFTDEPLTNPDGYIPPPK